MRICRYCYGGGIYGRKFRSTKRKCKEKWPRTERNFVSKSADTGGAQYWRCMRFGNSYSLMLNTRGVLKVGVEGGWEVFSKANKRGSY